MKQKVFFFFFWNSLDYLDYYVVQTERILTKRKVKGLFVGFWKKNIGIEHKYFKIYPIKSLDNGFSHNVNDFILVQLLTKSSKNVSHYYKINFIIIRIIE